MILEEIIQLYASYSDQSYSEHIDILSEQLTETKRLLDSIAESINLSEQSIRDIESMTGISSVDKSLLISSHLDYLNSAKSQRLNLMDKYMNLDKQLKLARSIEIVAAPSDVTVPVGPRRTLIVTVAGMLGLMMGIFAAFLREGLSRRE